MAVLLVRVTAPHFVAGLILESAICTRAAPILGWTVGRNGWDIERVIRARGWTAMARLIPRPS